MKFEMHTHTMENDPCSDVPADEMVKAYHKAGYEGLIVTNHYFCWMFEWFKKDLEGADHKGLIDRYLRGYRKAKAAGEELGMTVLLGIELRFDGTINDYLVYGLEESFLYESPVLNHMTLTSFLDIMPEDALLYQAHPFRDSMEIAPPWQLFGMETYNGATDPVRNNFAKMWAEDYFLKEISGSDFHRMEHLARGGLIFENEVKTNQDLISQLKAEQYSLIRTE
ncbi:MAG: transposase [Clostridiales bacterium]|nr:transposase [Clostridiales bacterium]